MKRKTKAVLEVSFFFFLESYFREFISSSQSETSRQRRTITNPASGQFSSMFNVPSLAYANLLLYLVKSPSYLPTYSCMELPSGCNRKFLFSLFALEQEQGTRLGKERKKGTHFLSWFTALQKEKEKKTSSQVPRPDRAKAKVALTLSWLVGCYSHS